ncbi:MAG: dethiobiotin synthase [Bacteroidia bacterium]|nr:dethiobiotin synthase [Bacteroidia bacterium]MDW8159785.1 dethiobiotin synthase [Bacteroidia bacterium]
MKQWIVTGTHTGIGKTLVSTILCLGLQAKYWKPIQTGSVEGTDSDFLASHIGKQNVFPESYCFLLPQSPHSAAQAEGALIDLKQIQFPQTTEPLIIEGAGGLLVPLNEQHLMIDLFEKLQRPIIVVAGMYLGTINHTLLTVKVLQHQRLPVAGIVFSGNEDLPVKDIIAHYAKVPILGHIPQLSCFETSYLRNCFWEYFDYHFLLKDS